MKEIILENITISLSREGNNVRVQSDKENVILFNQRVETVSELLTHNFKVVSGHYRLIISEAKDKFDFKDITIICIAILLHYLYMYNSWRSMYKKQENKDLRFNEKDFNNPSTHDILFDYFKTKYPNDWEEKCAILIGKELTELKTYYKTREEFYNK